MVVSVGVPVAVVSCGNAGNVGTRIATAIAMVAQRTRDLPLCGMREAQEIAQQFSTMSRHHGLRMKLDSPHWVLTMADRVNLGTIIASARGYLQLGGQCFWFDH